MSTETIVNRISISPGLAADIAEIEKVKKDSQPETLSVSPEPKPDDVDETKSNSGVTSVVWTGTEPPVLTPALSDGIDDDIDQIVLASSELLQELQDKGSLPSELSEFRKQVISAFKHLGLDTRKFFGV